MCVAMSALEHSHWTETEMSVKLIRERLVFADELSVTLCGVTALMTQSDW